MKEPITFEYDELRFAAEAIANDEKVKRRVVGDAEILAKFVEHHRRTLLDCLMGADLVAYRAEHELFRKLVADVLAGLVFAVQEGRIEYEHAVEHGACVGRKSAKAAWEAEREAAKLAKEEKVAK